MTTTQLSSHVLVRTLEQLSTATRLEQVTEIVAAAVRALMGADGATFVLREDGHCFYADENAIDPLWKGQRFPLTACVSGWSMLNRSVAVIPDIYADQRVPHDAYRPTFVQSMVMAPIRSDDPIGALGAYWAEQHEATPAQVRQLEVLANSTAVTLENLELRGAVARRESERDDLELAIHSMAHDLRNPVVAMMGYAELIEADAEDAPALAKTYARSIVNAGYRLSSQIDKMLALYRILERPLEAQPVDVTALGREVADQLTSTLTSTAPDRALRIEVEDGLDADADPVLLRIALENLMGNAVKYSATRTESLIELARAAGSDGAAETGEATFVVRDNGVGFEPDQAHRLFQPLTRLHADDFAGTGLGLASVAKIVELHGGTVRAEGRPGEGASFYFSLPSA
jgi:signal transduction histidine kinase